MGRFNLNLEKINEIFQYEQIIKNGNYEIEDVSTIKSNTQNVMIFVNKINEISIEKLKDKKECLIIIRQEDYEVVKNNFNDYIIVQNPRLEYAKISSGFLKKKRTDMRQDSIISKNAKIGKDVVIEPLCYIGENVSIGKNSIIMTGAKIKENTKIGDNCIIRENSVLGGYGFGFEKDEMNRNIRIEHIGGVEIGDYVEIGANTTICSGTIEVTKIENGVKIDDHVHIAHNCKIGENSIITACAEISGSCKIGKNVWIAPNVSILNGIEINDNAIIGIGAIIIKNVKKDATIVGNAAETLEDAKFFKEFKKGIIDKEKLCKQL